MAHTEKVLPENQPGTWRTLARASREHEAYRGGLPKGERTEEERLGASR